MDLLIYSSRHRRPDPANLSVPFKHILSYINSNNIYGANVTMQSTILKQFLLFILLALPLIAVGADKFEDAIEVFKGAGESGSFFDNSYGYAVFPTIGKAGLVVGGAHGKGRVYTNGNYVGDTTVTQVTAGFQLGAQTFSEIIFFKDKRAFEEFSSGKFGFSAEASAVAITAGASARATTEGSTAGASGGKNNAGTAGAYHKGMAVFSVAKGGLMYEATVGGQKFSYTAK